MTSFHSASGTVYSDRRYRYNGKERDEETGLYYYGARYYAAWLGRWTAVDPAPADGTCRYAYVRNCPIQLSDPNGRDPNNTTRDTATDFAARAKNSAYVGTAISLEPPPQPLQPFQAWLPQPEPFSPQVVQAAQASQAQQAKPRHPQAAAKHSDWQGPVGDFVQGLVGHQTEGLSLEGLKQQAGPGLKVLSQLGEGDIKGAAQAYVQATVAYNPGLALKNLITSNVETIGTGLRQAVAGGKSGEGGEALGRATSGAINLGALFLGGEGKLPEAADTAGGVKRVGTGRAYSVAFEYQLPEGTYPGLSEPAHFQLANKALLEAAKDIPALKKLIPTLEFLEGPRGGISRGSPHGWTWHHASEEGLLQLIPRVQHRAAGPIQDLLHPYDPASGKRVGGYEIWGKKKDQ